jgi:hypothetical protein
LGTSVPPGPAASGKQDGGFPFVPSVSIDTLWFQVAGTICNLKCTHCFISCSPTNHSHGMLTLEEVRGRLDEAARLGVREYYFTGGEPFLNAEMMPIIEATLAQGPVSILTNGLLLTRQICRGLKRLSDASDYSLDIRISIDGYTEEVNDPIRGAGTYRRILDGIRNLAEAGLNPVITVTEACGEAASAQGTRAIPGMDETDRPRVAAAQDPVALSDRAEEQRLRAYDRGNPARPAPHAGRVGEGSSAPPCRMVTSKGVTSVPILIDEPRARMGDSLAETMRPFELAFSSCFTCHEHGVTCRT